MKKITESPKNKAKGFVPAPKERSKHATSRFFFAIEEKNK